MEPLGRGKAEARSRLRVQRRVQRCWARPSSRPAHRRAVPAAPSMDKQLNPQENMASLRGWGIRGGLGRWEGRGLKNYAELTYPVQKRPRVRDQAAD